MAIIFEDKRVELNDIEKGLRFPRDAKIGHLPFDCSNDGQLGKLPVIDEKGFQWTLTCIKRNRIIYFTDGWKEFSKGIRVGHRITLYKEDDSFGSGGAQYKITVRKN
ncbi:hypothetical protein SLEP1_g40950 [Rubroshorea leprosula]|uniref:TF-B3 domain-containing protein n=1 Tax=Rubroshorea leprosula TaxID=152421 RepID=A0AAV5L5W0_9ROSI|nr:hypothetical protein SLEP1_g40863 [Rubroshorea leprosula]GKV32334.1 hypothetical protein SLEP1_g40950 [Rubroshorea leprosula]